MLQESRPLAFSTQLDVLRREDLLELPPYYLKAIAAQEHFDVRDCMTRFELADRIVARGAVAKDSTTESHVRSCLNISC